MNRALITGGSRGIGAAIANKLASENFDVTLVGRSDKQLLRVAEECREEGAKVDTFLADFLLPNDVRKLCEHIKTTPAPYSAFIHSAGISKHEKYLDADLEFWSKIQEVNYMSAVKIGQVIAQQMAKNECGAMVFISSIAGKITYGTGGAYASSKHALSAFSSCIFDDVRKFGIKVCSIHPGLVATDMTSNSKVDPGLMIQPYDVAEAVSYVIGSSDTCCPTEITLRPQKETRPA